ncbi:MAG: penicillin-binding protein 1C [Candidatus Kapabacteria bacterium]|nr:penicillin-binding protein 1C [Candidatus Kapabacteria bacterium]
MICSFLVLDKIFPVDTTIKYSKTIKSREGIILSSFLSSDDKWRYYFKTNEISEYFKKSIIFKEDKYFYYHAGVNPVSIIRSFSNNLKSGKITSGASTITMQTARLLEPKKRTYINKIIEIFRAFQLELHYSKDDILEIYLNKIPFGSNIEGVGAASVLYFGRNPDKLSLAQATGLAVIPNNPNKLNIKIEGNSINTEKNNLLKKHKSNKLFSADIVDDAINEFIKPEKLQSPVLARHLSFRAAKEFAARRNIETTINYTIQSRFEDIIKGYVTEIARFGIMNASAYLIDNSTGEVLAYIGSNDFNSEYSGQVDGVTSIRSPGSTLKPFLYAFAVDKGMITPKLSLLDVPILNSEYSPDNFDGLFRGRVTAESALALSLNVPAVNLLNEYGLSNYINQRTQFEFKSISKFRRKLGLSLILGGGGVTLEELCNAYSSLASDGFFRKSYYTLSKSNIKPKRLISPEAAYLISEILTKHSRPDMPAHFRTKKGLPKIAWKTGTSQGRRDGWAIGYNKLYTLGVWTGNFSGKPNSMISGADIAVPMLFELFSTLPHQVTEQIFSKPSNIDERLVDAVTGLLPSELSDKITTDYYIPEVSLSKKTDHLVKIWVSNDERISYCSDCMPSENIKSQIYEIYPIELKLYYNSINFKTQFIPPHNPDCTAFQPGMNPLITSPLKNSEYILEKDSNDGIPLKAGLDKDAGKSYWFVNGKFLESTNSNQSTIWKPEVSGKYSITCIDDRGRSNDVKISVKIY